MKGIDVAFANIPQARGWASAAVGALNQIIGFNGKRKEIDNLPQFKAVKTHFHLTLGPPPSFLSNLLSLLPGFDEADSTLALLKEIRFRYFDILGVLSNNKNFVGTDSTLDEDGEKPSPNWTPRNRDGPIRITPLYLTLGPLNQVFNLVHESAHFLDIGFQDYAYRDRTGEEDQLKYIRLPVQFAIRNPDSYAYFAFQMAKGVDRIFTAPYSD